MIRTVADMLAKLAEREAAMLAEMTIKHGPTIGSMYEGLTRDLLERAIPSSLDLQIVGGFVIDGRGGTSGQIDCMLVRGEGEPVPYVPGVFRWHVRDVIAVFEIKKKLFGSGLAEAYDQLGKVADVYGAWIHNAKGDSELDLRPAFRAYSDITGEVAPPPDQWNDMDPAKHMILHIVMQDQIAPLRIMFGYDGYRSEASLRKGFLDFTEGNLNRLGFGPDRLPSLIVAGGNSLVKMSGHPYLVPRHSNGRWPILCSSHLNPINLILELIWTRISYDRPILSWFGDDLETEEMVLLLEAMPIERPGHPGQWGWNYYSTEVADEELGGPALVDWEPFELNDEQQTVLTLAMGGHEVRKDDPEGTAYIRDNGHDPDQFWHVLIATRLVAFNGNVLEVTAREPMIVNTADGHTYAADNASGRFSRWLARRPSSSQVGIHTTGEDGAL